MSTLELQGIHKSFGAVATLRGIDLAIADGEFLVFVGPSGCGKSTLLRIAAGLESASRGQVLIDGQDCTDAPPSQRRMAMVFQSYALYPHMTVRQNLSFGMRMRGEPRAAIEGKLERAIEMLQLAPYLERKPGELSGGQCQRVAIGRAIVQEPGAFLFDEPLSNLDAELRLRMRLEIAALHRSLKTTMVYVTHDQVEAMTLAQRIVVLRDGRIEQVGTPMALYDEPANTFVAGFIGSPAMNLLPPRAGAGTGAAELPAATAQIGIRPEHLQLRDDGAWAMDLQAIERLGASTFLHGTLDGAALCCEHRGELQAAPGGRVRVSPSPGKVHAFDAQGRRLAPPKPRPQGTR
jgi:ABC-type sugar transport system ATPase subunit